MLQKKNPRKWILESPQKAMKEIFYNRGMKEISPEYAVEFTSQFGGQSVEPAQVQQLFSNWAKKHRKALKEACNAHQTMVSIFLQLLQILSTLTMLCTHFYRLPKLLK
jgi:hypothetical protein